jgi:hypothetical protein
MRRGICALCAALLLAAGCDLQGNFLVKSPLPCTSWGKPQGDRVVAASLDSVSQSTQDSLKALGIETTSSQQGDDVRISGMTRTGSKFAFVLHRVKTSTGETTRVRIEWEKSEDAKANPTVVNILADLEVAAVGRATTRNPGE